MALRIFGNIITPCEANWDKMEGDGSVRFCKECKLKVYNFTELTDTEVLAAIDATKGARLCARIVKRSDGSISTDNCPYKLRRVRNAIRRTAPWMFLLCAFVFRQSFAEAQGLVGSPVDPRFGQSGGCEVQGLADYGYDTARDISRVVTALSTIPSTMFAMLYVSKRVGWTWPRRRGCSQHKVTDHPLFRAKKWSWSVILVGLIILYGIPTMVHLIGTFSINNYGGIAGSL
jgi:hypothetical protein